MHCHYNNNNYTAIVSLQPIGLSLFDKFNDSFKKDDGVEQLCTCLTTCEIDKLYEPTAHEMTDEDLDNLCVEKIKELTVTKEQSEHVKMKTCEQLKSTLRVCHVTASQVHSER